jgi:hypothetical protein
VKILLPSRRQRLLPASLLLLVWLLLLLLLLVLLPVLLLLLPPRHMWMLLVLMGVLLLLLLLALRLRLLTLAAASSTVTSRCIFSSAAGAPATAALTINSCTARASPCVLPPKPPLLLQLLHQAQLLQVTPSNYLSCCVDCFLRLQPGTPASIRICCKGDARLLLLLLCWGTADKMPVSTAYCMSMCLHLHFLFTFFAALLAIYKCHQAAVAAALQCIMQQLLCCGPLAPVHTVIAAAAAAAVGAAYIVLNKACIFLLLQLLLCIG